MASRRWWWPTAFALVLSDAGNDVALWARRPELAATINAEHRNPDYAPGIALPETLRALSDPAEAMSGADVVVLACGAVETARLMLLSRSAAHPHGLGNENDLVGRNVTFHEFSSAVATFDDPIHAWAGGGYVSASSFEFYGHDDSRGFAGGGHMATSGVGIPLPINWSLPDRPAWGAEAKRGDREHCNHTMAASMVVPDLPQHDNRVDLDDEVVDDWGMPVARITLTPHENDLAMGRFLIDRSAEILEAAGATSIQKVYPDRVTGNCSHQHGTTRMGNDPSTSVLDRDCRLHTADNVFVVDGGSFPTGTGANPTLTIMANAWRVAERIAAGRDASSRG